MNTALRDISLSMKQWKIWVTMAYREVQLSIKRTILGPVWLVLNRIFFAFAFSLLGAILWGASGGMKIEILVGFLVFATMIGYLMIANSALMSSTNLVDSGLPISLRIFKAWAKEFMLSVLSVFILLAVAWHAGHLNFYVISLILLVTIVMSLWGLGIIFLISPIALRFRDVAQIVNLSSTLLMFFSPIFWNLNDIKNRELAERILFFNPIADFIFMFRDITILGRFNYELMTHSMVQIAIINILGFLVFRFSFNRIPYWVG